MKIIHLDQTSRVLASLRPPPTLPGTPEPVQEHPGKHRQNVRIQSNHECRMCCDYDWLFLGKVTLPETKKFHLKHWGSDEFPFRKATERAEICRNFANSWPLQGDDTFTSLRSRRSHVAYIKGLGGRGEFQVILLGIFGQRSWGWNCKIWPKGPKANSKIKRNLVEKWPMPPGCWWKAPSILKMVRYQDDAPNPRRWKITSRSFGGSSFCSACPFCHF